jgi:hypothetical protein
LKDSLDKNVAMHVSSIDMATAIMGKHLQLHENNCNYTKTIIVIGIWNCVTVIRLHTTTTLNQNISIGG